MPTSDFNRRVLAKVVAGTALVTGRAEPAFARPRLGVVANVSGSRTPDEAIAEVSALGFRTCQVHVGLSPDGLAPMVKAAPDDAFPEYGRIPLRDGRLPV